MSSPLFIGIAGGTGSGKSWLANEILNHFGPERCALVEQDWYYRDLSHLPLAEAEKTNFDHPDSVELDFLQRHLDLLKQGKPIDAPQYAFSKFSRDIDTLAIDPKPIVVVEGLFVFIPDSLRNLFSYKVFVETDADIRLARRLQRDLSERGYTLEQVLDFWLGRAHPMHAQFVDPQRSLCDLVWNSLQDKAFVPQFLADLEDRLASNALRSQPTEERSGPR